MFSLYWDYYACLMCFKCRFNTGAQTRLFLWYRGVYARALTTVGPDEKGLVFLHFFSYLYTWRGWVDRSLFRKDQVFLFSIVLNNFRAWNGFFPSSVAGSDLTLVMHQTYLCDDIGLKYQKIIHHYIRFIYLNWLIHIVYDFNAMFTMYMCLNHFSRRYLQMRHVKTTRI